MAFDIAPEMATHDAEGIIRRLDHPRERYIPNLRRAMGAVAGEPSPQMCFHLWA